MTLFIHSSPLKSTSSPPKRLNTESNTPKYYEEKER